MLLVADEKLNFAVFIDYDNIEIGVKSTLNREFDVADEMYSTTLVKSTESRS